VQPSIDTASPLGGEGERRVMVLLSDGGQGQGQGDSSVLGGLGGWPCSTGYSTVCAGGNNTKQKVRDGVGVCGCLLLWNTLAPCLTQPAG
jgi:hypothetical protein